MKIGKLASEINGIRTDLERGIYKNEAAVRQGIVDPLLQWLGWRTNDTTIVCPEYAIANGKVDYALCHPPQTPMVLIEVKRVGNITGAEEQLFWYAFRQGVPILILTDGRLWRFFYPSGIGTYNDRLVCELDLSETDSDKNASKLQRYLSYAAIRNGVAIDDITDDYRELASQRAASASLPETWRKLVDGADERLIDVLAEATKDDCGHKPSRERILGFLKTLESTQETGMEHHNDVPPPTPDSRSPGSTPRTERYIAYFQTLIDELREQHNFTKARLPKKGSNSYSFSSGFPPMWYTAGFNKARTVYTQLSINFRDYETTKNFFDVLKERESEINANFEAPYSKFRGPLYWNRRDDLLSSRIYIQRDGDIESSESELEAFRTWHVENLLKFKEVFTPEIQLALEKLQSRETERQ